MGFTKDAAAAKSNRFSIDIATLNGKTTRAFAGSSFLCNSFSVRLVRAGQTPGVTLVFLFRLDPVNPVNPVWSLFFFASSRLRVRLKINSIAGWPQGLQS